MVYAEKKALEQALPVKNRGQSRHWLAGPLLRGFDAAVTIAHRGIQRIEPNMAAIGICGALMFPAYWVVWRYLFPQPYENLALRLVGSVFCLVLVLKDRWPAPLRRYLPVYWLGMLLFCLPFFFTYMLLQNGASTIWVMSTLTALFLLVLLVDWLSLIILFVGGSLLAWVVEILTAPYVRAPDLYVEYLPVFMFVLIAGTVFNYSAETLRLARQRAMAEIGMSVASEMRSPLSGIRTGSVSLRKYLPVLLRAYETARAGGLSVTPLPQQHLQALQQVPERIEEEAEHINAIIDMLLMSGGESARPPPPPQFQFHSVGSCLEAALRHYPFSSDLERAKVLWRREQDFSFFGSDVLMRQLLSIVLRTMLRTVATRGELVIQAEISGDWNTLRLTDTASRAAPAALPRLLQPLVGSNDGDVSAMPDLAFCKLVMEQLGGHITGRIELRSLSELTLWFPRPQPARAAG